MSMNKNNKFNDHQIMYLTPVEAYTLMNSSMEGLSEVQVKERIEKYGKNEIASKKETPMIKKLFSEHGKTIGVVVYLQFCQEL